MLQYVLDIMLVALFVIYYLWTHSHLERLEQQAREAEEHADMCNARAELYREAINEGREVTEEDALPTSRS